MAIFPRTLPAGSCRLDVDMAGVEAVDVGSRVQRNAAERAEPPQLGRASSGSPLPTRCGYCWPGAERNERSDMLLSLAVLTGARRGARCVRCRANSRNPARCSSCRRLVPPCSHKASADCPESRDHLDFACAGLTCPGRHPDSRALQSGPRGSHVVPRPKRRWEPCRQRSEARPLRAPWCR